MLGPILRGEKLSLEPTRREDLGLFRTWLMDERVTRYLLRRFVPSDKAEEEWYDGVSSDHGAVAWSLIVNGKTIGNTAIGGIDWINRHGTTGMLIGETSQWGKGYASEAVRLRTAFAFNELNLERLESESFVDNVAMHRALEKSGYQNIGRKRRHMFRNGAWHDLFVFEVLRHEWLAREQ